MKLFLDIRGEGNLQRRHAGLFLGLEHVYVPRIVQRGSEDMTAERAGVSKYSLSANDHL